MKFFKNRNVLIAFTLLVLTVVIGLLPIEFLISALLFGLVFRGWLFLIKLAIASDPEANELDNR